MFRKSSTGTRRIRSVHVVAAGALVLAMSGSATAAMVITGKQIKDNSVTGKDIKNGSLLVKDLKASEVAKLRGSTGATGATGATGGTGATGATGTAGASAFAPPPSGTVITGGGLLNVQVSAGGVDLRDYAPLPFKPVTPFSRTTPRNIWFGSTSLDPAVTASERDATACQGDATTPAPTAGQLCIYPKVVTRASGLFVYPGIDTGTDAVESNGFYVYGLSSSAGEVIVRYVWAYKAP